MGASVDASNPPGEASDRRPPMQPALRDNDLMCQVLDAANLHRAWKRVRQNGGAPGVDGMSIEDFPAWARLHWVETRQALMEGTYQPQPVRSKAIPKPAGGERWLGIPTVVDRVIQQAIAQVLEPRFDPHFSESSHGFRPGRSAHGAIRQVQRAIRDGFKVAVDLDLAKFFDRVDHDVLMSRVSRRVPDKRVLRLIGRYLRAGMDKEGRLQATTRGVPQGGPLSPLLSNVVLDDFDRELERRGHRFARYADDVVILVRSARAGQRVMASVTRWLDVHLRLEVNDAKSQVAPTHQTSFLGFTFRGAKVRWSAQTQTRFKAEVRKLTNRNWGVSMSRRLTELGRYLRGWMGYFGLSEYYRPIPDLDRWIRRRVRMCYWIQWRRPRTRIKRLLSLGVPIVTAVGTGRSSKGPWHMSRCHAMNAGLSDAFLAREGLLSVKSLWVERASLR